MKISASTLVPSRKQCRVCHKIKPLTDFFKRGGEEKGYRSKCKSCYGAASAILKSKPENRIKQAAYMRDHRANDREAWKSASLKYRYNITIDEWNDLFDRQDGKCAICEIAFSMTPQVDHCHDTLIVRGLLCGDCNRMLGQARESASILRKGAEYLEDFS